MEVHKAGGGIHYTVDHTRQASEEELFLTFESRLMAMRNIGIKTVTLTLKAPITTAADDIHKYFSLFFRENKT